MAPSCVFGRQVALAVLLTLPFRKQMPALLLQVIQTGDSVDFWAFSRACPSVLGEHLELGGCAKREASSPYVRVISSQPQPGILTS